MTPGFVALGKMLIFFGLALILAGIFLASLNKIPFLGKLPGDICIARKNFTFYFPLITCLLISALVSFILWLWRKR